MRRIIAFRGLVQPKQKQMFYELLPYCLRLDNIFLTRVCKRYTIHELCFGNELILHHPITGEHFCNLLSENNSKIIEPGFKLKLVVSHPYSKPSMFNYNIYGEQPDW